MAKHKYIETPEVMWILFEDYIKYLKKNPIIIKDWVGGMAKEVLREKERPVTMEGFREFGHKQGVTIKHYFDNQDGNYDDYCTICTRIKDFIRTEQIEGGMAGIYNSSITQRLNNLVDKQETSISIPPMFPD